MGDDAVGRLLQALQRSQLRVRSLRFRGNGIGSAGGGDGGHGGQGGDGKGWKGCLFFMVDLSIFCLWSGTCILFDHPARIQATSLCGPS